MNALVDVPVFSNQWFERHQRILLRFLNAQETRYIMREKLMIPNNELVVRRIGPHFVSLSDSFKNPCRITRFYTFPRFGRLLFKRFNHLWNIFHEWDRLIAERIIPALDFGFATLTAYPDSGGGGSTADGQLQHYGTGLSWANLRAGIGGTKAASTSDSTPVVPYLQLDSSGSTWGHCYRGYYTADTSAIGTDDISSALLSIRTRSASSDDFSSSIDLVEYTGADVPAANGEDYSNFGDTLIGTSIAIASMSNHTRHDYDLDVGQLGIINKTGVTGLGHRISNDRINSEPSGESLGASYFEMRHAEDSGSEPYIQVVHTAAPVEVGVSLGTSLGETFGRKITLPVNISFNTQLDQANLPIISFMRSASFDMQLDISQIPLRGSNQALLLPMEVDQSLLGTALALGNLTAALELTQTLDQIAVAVDSIELNTILSYLIQSGTLSEADITLAKQMGFSSDSLLIQGIWMTLALEMDYAVSGSKLLDALISFASSYAQSISATAAAVDDVTYQLSMGQTLLGSRGFTASTQFDITLESLLVSGIAFPVDLTMALGVTAAAKGIKGTAGAFSLGLGLTYDHSVLGSFYATLSNLMRLGQQIDSQADALDSVSMNIRMNQTQQALASALASTSLPVQLTQSSAARATVVAMMSLAAEFGQGLSQIRAMQEDIALLLSTGATFNAEIAIDADLVLAIEQALVPDSIRGRSAQTIIALGLAMAAIGGASSKANISLDIIKDVQLIGGKAIVDLGSGRVFIIEVEDRTFKITRRTDDDD